MRSRVSIAIVLLALLPQLAGAAGRRPAILLAAGDIADCSSPGDSLTAKLIERLPGTVAALGDTVYPIGSASDYRRCYEPTWGHFKVRTRPAVGNHEYGTDGARGYFSYFGTKAAPPGGYYSYKLGSWHIVVVNSNCDPAGGCGVGSPQVAWLRADLRSHPSRCTLAYWHHPRFSSGRPDEAMQPIWALLARSGVDVVLNGHDHEYERFAPLGANGERNPKHGIREFVVGTGGRALYPVLRRAAASERVIAFRWGVLRLELGDGSYRWRFLAAPGGATLDGGSGSCR